MERLGGDHVLHQMEIMTFNNQENISSIKEILVSLQKDVASCLCKLEMGWGNKGKEFWLDPGTDRQGLKEWASSGEMEDGPVQPKQVVEPVDKSTRIQIIKRYRKIYVRRNPPKRWRPKTVGRMDQPVIAAMLENDRNSALEQSKEVSGTEQADENGGQVQEGCRMAAEETTGGVEGAGELPGPHRDFQMELESGLGGEELADQHTGVASGDKKEGSAEGCAISPVAGGMPEMRRSGLSSSKSCSVRWKRLTDRVGQKFWVIATWVCTQWVPSCRRILAIIVGRRRVAT
jgi:hypothetical protein